MEKQKLAGVGLMLLWCVGLLLYRDYLGHNPFFGSGERSTRWLLWNLFLAVLPLLWSTAFQAASDRRHPVLAGLAFVLWLVFLPNAPYIITDLLHLRPSPPAPMWCLLAMLVSCAGTGTMLGYLSLLQVQSVVAQRAGKVWGWLVAIIALLLCGFGIYLGRFLRWNSWDAFVHPFGLARSIAGQFHDPGSGPQPFTVTLVYGIGLIVGYLMLRVFSAGGRKENGR